MHTIALLQGTAFRGLYTEVTATIAKKNTAIIAAPHWHSCEESWLHLQSLQYITTAYYNTYTELVTDSWAAEQGNQVEVDEVYSIFVYFYFKIF